eukprot:3002017-Amphidinium_carterae.1
MQSVGAGCSWIAKKKIVHLGLKMQNVLIAKTWDAEGTVKYQPKIADYGLAQRRSAWAMDDAD